MNRILRAFAFQSPEKDRERILKEDLKVQAIVLTGAVITLGALAVDTLIQRIKINKNS